jgi:acylphosphatase
MDRKTLHAIVHGRVQGVFFRASTQDEALRLGLCGWARNLPDGTVEVLASGPAEGLHELLVWLHQGPGTARVDRVDVEWRAPGPDLPSSFSITG